MNRRDIRSLLSKIGVPAGRAAQVPGDRTELLLRLVGRALGLDGRQAGMESLSGGRGFEALEQRALLEGSFASPTVLTLDVNSQATGPGFINPSVSSTDNDFYSFTAASNGFVSVLADTSNEAPASSLNTRVRVFNSAQQQIAQGTTNGTLTTGVANDGWAGFIAQAGQTYFVVVSSDGAVTPGTPGAYTLRVNAQNVTFDLGGETPIDTGIGREAGSPIPAPPFVPITPILGQLGGLGPTASRIRQSDIVYRFDVPASSEYDSLVTINAQSTQGNLSRRLDTRVDVYNAQGQLVAFDSDSGRINDAFATLRARPGETYYIRVRSDEVRTRDAQGNPPPGTTNIENATGPFFLVLDAIADKLQLNAVTRRTFLSSSFDGFGDPTTAPDPAMANPSFQSRLFEFTSQGSGLTFVTVQPTGLAPVTDPAVRLIDENGTLVAFNDNFAGLSAQIEAQLVGGRRYFVVVDGFEVASAVQFTLGIESNHTFSPTAPWDDHVDTVFVADDATPAELQAQRLQNQLATSLIFTDPFETFDADGNLVRDRALRQRATATGRIHTAGDRDLFQFTAPVDMLNNHAGNNDDSGTSLFVGGAFGLSDPNVARPNNSRNLSIWDAADWWYTGAQNFDPDFNVTYGFNDNPDTPGTTRPEIYALYDWDLDPTGEPAGGLTDNVLLVGGDFDLIVPTPFGPVTLKNFAVWFQDPDTGRFGWGSLGDTDGPVRAFTEYDPEEFDPDGSGPLDTIPDPNDSDVPLLVVGGSFTDIDGTAVNNLAFFDLNAPGWQDLGGGVTGTVHALTVYDPPDPGDERTYQEPQPPDPELRYVADTPDIPRSLFVGGAFTQGTRTNLAGWNGVNFFSAASGRVNPAPGDPGDPPPVPPFGGTPLTNGNINGPVFALTTFDAPDPDGAGPEPDPETVLIVGGRFTNAGGTAALNLAQWGQIDPDQDPTTTGTYEPKLLWEQVGTGIPDAGAPSEVLALTVWDIPDINNLAIPPVLVVGGTFDLDADPTTGGNIAAWNGQDFLLIGGAQNNGTNATVRALTVLTDDQEPGIESDLDSGNPQQVLYVGGDFTEVYNGDPGDPVLANRVAQFSAFTGVNNPDDFLAWSTLGGGVDNTAADPSVPSVFALLGFDDGNPFEWDRHDRRATRMSISVSPAEGSFINARVRVYDSNFNVVYGFDRDGSETIAPPFPDPAGMVDGSLAAPTFNTEFEGISLWGGETYYIEVSDYAGTTDDVDPANPRAGARGGTGRYTMTVVTDAAPTDITGDGLPDEVNAVFREEPNEGRFAQALAINTTLANGDGTNVRGSDTLPLKGNESRTMKVTPSLNASYTQRGDIGNISSITDTDLYTFRAEFTGTVEIRIATTGITDRFGEQIGTAFAGQTKTYNSQLDSAMRVYRNDFEQIAYNDDNYANRGEFQVDNVGTITGAFYRRDARIVIFVEAGQNYFIQVESGQRYKRAESALAEDPLNPTDPTRRESNIAKEIDERNATGSYILLINQMPNQQAEIVNGQPVIDDHIDANGQLATVIPIVDRLGDEDNGTGTILGVIDNTPLNPTDTDLFRLMAPGNGTLSIRLSRTAGSTLLSTVQLADAATGNLITTGVPVDSNGTILVTLSNVVAGDTFVLVVNGTGGTEGGYRLDVSGVPAVDDRGDYKKWWNATDITIRDFQGQGTASGRIETAGDTDIYRFSFDEFQTMSLRVDATDATLNPFITVYEVSEDPSGNPIFLRIGWDDDSGGNGSSLVNVSVAPTREKAGPPAREYTYYYVVVSGSDINSHFGSYNLTVGFPPTDDHADGDTDADGQLDTGEYAFATTVSIDSSTGLGVTTGEIERATDSDLFVFTAPASGTVSVLVSRPNDSTIRPMVTILDESGAILASNIGGDDLITFQASASTAATRNTRYFIVVQGFEDPLTPNVNTTVTGSYNVSVTAPPIDDHANQNEFNLATNIPINGTTGDGQLGGDAGDDPINPRLGPSGDTDLFTFTTLNLALTGSVTIRITPFSSAAGILAPRVTVFDALGNQIGLPDEAGTPLEEVSITLPFARNTRYYVLVSAVTGIPFTTQTGEYRVVVDGPTPDSGGTDPDDPGEIDFANPTTIALNGRTGDGKASDSISVAGDRDLFTFTAAATGPIFLQMVTSGGSLLDGSLRVLNAANENASIAFDSDGIPGATANLSFNAVAGQQYWVIVDGLGDGVGSYQIVVNSQPVKNFLYFPEGNNKGVIREFISVVNPNNADTTYRVVLYHENGGLTTRSRLLTVDANSRSGIDVQDPFYWETTLPVDNPYAVVIESELPLGATMAHYDFGNSVGDSFTERLAATWHFPRVERSAGNAVDFLVFFNPNQFSVNVTLTAFDAAGNSVSLPTLTFAGESRGGWAISNYNQLPQGVFSVTLSATAAFSADNAAFAESGIVAGLTHFAPGTDSGFAYLGDPDGGATRGVITNLAQGSRLDSEIAIFNPGTTPVNVSLTGTYIRATLPQFTRNVQIPARGRVTITGSQLGLLADQPIGIRYVSDGAVSVMSNETQLGDADGSLANTRAATRFFFGDAYVDPANAGSKYFETLYIHNPSSQAGSVAIRLLFIDGTTSTFNVAVGARGFAEVALHDRPEIRNNTAGPWFAVDLSSALPFNVQMVHYDLAIGGGWSTSAIPFGITNPVASIT